MPPSLRDNVFRDPLSTDADFNATNIASMGELRKGFVGGRITSEMNPLLAQEAGLRKAAEQGDNNAAVQADALRQQITGLQARRQAYAPAVGRVEDINWEPGRLLDWGAGQVGQGVASMMDPIAASAGLNAAANVVGMSKNPIAQAASLAARGLSYAVPAYMSQRQQAGETYGSMLEDPELMARTTAAQRADSANFSGAIQAIPDTFLPAMVGGRLAGNGLRQGLSKIPTRAKFAGDLLGEGAGEVFQEAGKQQTLGYLNPDRDTTGDASDLLNAGLGAMAGASPISGASHFADGGFRRVGEAGREGSNLVKETAGGVVDLYNQNAAPAVDAAIEKAGGLFGKAKDKVVDLAKGDDGKITPESVLEGLKTAAQDLKPKPRNGLDEDTVNTLTVVPPQGLDVNSAEGEAWLRQNMQERTNLAAEHLEKLAADGDQKAGELLRNIDNAPDNVALDQSLNEGVQHILDQHAENALEQHAANAGRIAGDVGRKVGGLAMRAGKAAAGVGKDLFKGVVEGARKKNAQVADDGDNFTYSDWRKLQDSLSQKPLAEGASYNRSVAFAQKAKLAADYAADMAARNRAKGSAVPNMGRRLAFEIADMNEGFKASSAERSVRAAPVGREARLNRIASDVRRVYGPQADEVINQLGGILGPTHNDVVRYLKNELVEQAKPENKRREEQQRAELARQLVDLVPTDRAQALMDQEINLRTPGAADHLLSTVERLVSGYHGTTTAQYRAAVEQHFGKDAVKEMIKLVNGADEEKQSLGGEVVDDRGQGEESDDLVYNDDGEMGYADERAQTSDYVQRQGEKEARRGAVTPLYGAYKTKNPAMGDNQRNTQGPFAPDKEGKRPRLFKKDTTLSNGKNALAERQRSLTKSLGGQSKQYVIGAKPALHVMADLGWDDAAKTSVVGDQRTGAALVSAHRDYALQEANDLEVQSKARLDKAAELSTQVDSKTYPGVALEGRRKVAALRAESKAMMAEAEALRKEIADHEPAHNDLIGDVRAGWEAPKTEDLSDSAGRRRAVVAARKFFSERFLAAATQPGDREGTRISVGEVTEMDRAGHGALNKARQSGGQAAADARNRGGSKEEQADAKHAAEKQAISDANLIHFFKPGVRKDGQPAPQLVLKASDLVRWVRAHKAEKDVGKEKEPDRTPEGKDKAFLRDVLDGIAMMADSGLVRKDALPFKMNTDGQPEKFRKGVIPPSLRLVSGTAGERQAAHEAKVREARAKTIEREVEIFRTAYDEDVAERAMAARDTKPNSEYMQKLARAARIAERKGLKDATRQEIGEADLRDEWFTPESESQEIEPTVQPLRNEDPDSVQIPLVPRKAAVGGQFSAHEPVETKRRVPRMSEGGEADPNAQKSGAVVRNEHGVVGEKPYEEAKGVPYRVGEQPNTSKPKTESESATPLDFFGAQKEGAVPDEFADQQYQTRNSGKNADIGPEPKSTAVTSARFRADKLVAQLIEDPEAGTAAVLSRMRSALRPENFSKEGQLVVGGAHYAAPLAEMLSRRVDGTKPSALQQTTELTSPEMVKDMYKVVAEALLKENSSLTVANRVALTRLLARDPSKVAAANFRGNLQALLENQGGPIDKKMLANMMPGWKATDKGTPTAKKGQNLTTDQMFAEEDYRSLDTKAKVDEFLEEARARYKELKSRDDLTPTQRKAYGTLESLFGKNSTADLDSFYDGIKDAPAKEAGASLGKPQSPRGGGVNVEVTESSASGYRERTQHNANSAGATVAIAVNYATAGERLTKNVAGDKYIALGFDKDPRAAGKELAAFMKERGTTTLNVAGNGIYTLVADGWTQETVNQHVYAVLAEANRRSPITKIVSGGQTGVDIAGAVAAKALGIPAVITLPKGYVQRNAQGVDQRVGKAVVERQIEDGAKKLAGDTLWADGKRKLNAMAADIHRDLGREGFAATHDSPIKHEGKFDWRAHKGKGEGNASFGAGTYLSTANGVHRSYKKQFSGGRAETEYLQRALKEVNDQLRDTHPKPTAKEVREYVEENLREYLDGSDGWLDMEIRDALQELRTLTDERLLEGPSPTYEVSVNIKPEQLLDWDAPMEEQSALVKKAKGEILNKLWRGMGAFDAGYDRYVEQVEDGTAHGATMYSALAELFGSQAKASDYLQSLGILGHKYAAAGGTNDTHPNYVIYDDSKITTNYVHFNKQDARRSAGQPSTPEQMAEAKEYVKKVLGPLIRVDFENLTGYSGEWLEADNIIKIATASAAGAMQTAYHEALHAFFSKFVKNDPKVFNVLRTLAEDAEIVARVRALLHGYPEAQAQLDENGGGEERLAYIYQFWAAGMLNLPGEPKTVFQKITRFFRRVLGRITDMERATAIYEAFHRGEFAKDPSDAGRAIQKALSEGTLTTKQLRRWDAAVQKVRTLTMSASTILAESDSPAAQALGKIFWTNPGDGTHGGEEEGYLNARMAEARRYTNLFSKYVQGLSERDVRVVLDKLQEEDDNLGDLAYAPQREAAESIRKLLNRFYKYMTLGRGMKIGDRGQFYFPRAWSTTALSAKHAEFINMLTTHYTPVLDSAVTASKGAVTREQVAERIYSKLLSNSVGDHLPPQRDDGVLAPFFASKEGRELGWIRGEHAKDFMSKDLVKTLTTYFHNGARHAEYASRFGSDGSGLAQQLQIVKNELLEAGNRKVSSGELADRPARDKWVARQYEQVTQAIGAMEGSLGKDISDGWRTTTAWMTVYQNIRLLPLALFASVVDPLGMVARGASMSEAFDTFMRGMREVVRDWKDLVSDKPKKRQQDEWERLALASGSVDAAMFSHHVSEEYSSEYLGPRAKKWNDIFFKANGMEAWNRGTRVGATKSAALFIERHSKLPEVHSERWLKELGLTAADITLNPEGHLITDKQTLMAQKGIGQRQAEQEIEKLYYAINRWVEGAIITPNAAQRPSWASDPHWSMFFHLKQFTYSFHQTILKRAVNEMNYGNMAPMGAFLWYVPVMIASDVTKGLLQGGGELPSYMKGMTLGDWMSRGVERAGLLGMGQIGVDARQDIWSLGGPAVEQLMDSFTEPLRKTTLNALPAHAVFAEAVR